MTHPSRNPYSPPEAPLTDPDTDVAPQRNYLLEAVKAFATIAGLFAGWIVIGSGLINGKRSLVLLGVAIMVVTCALGVARKVKRWQK